MFLKDICQVQMFGKLLIVALLSVFPEIDAQIPSVWKCPNVTPIANLNASRLVGVWYEVERYFTVTEIGSSCATCTFGQNVSGLNGTSTIPSMYNLKEVGGIEMSVNGTDYVDSNGLLTTKFNFNLGVPRDFLYLDIDYDDYCVAYHCHNILGGAFHSTSLWIYSRTRNITQTSLDKAHKAMDDQKISRTFLVTSDQKDCKPPPTFC